MAQRRARVVVAMSGGVDSSIAAYLLKERGYDVIGLFMRLGLEPRAAAGGRVGTESAERAAGGTTGTTLSACSTTRRCCSAEDADDARRVAARIGIRFYALDFAPEFERIIEYFVSEYTAGRTPNPCALCNAWLKFGRLWQYAQQFEADYIATGHHARVCIMAGCGRRHDPRLHLPAGWTGQPAGSVEPSALFECDAAGGLVAPDADWALVCGADPGQRSNVFLVRAATRASSTPVAAGRLA